MKKIFVIAVVAIMGLFTASHVFAAPVCEYFEDIGFVYISGSAGSENAYKTVNMMVKEKDNDEPDKDSLIYIADFKTDKNGDYVYKFKIKLSKQPENYYIHTNIGGKTTEKTDLIKGEWLLVNTPVYDRDNSTITFSGLYKYESDNKDLRIKIKSGKLDTVTDWDTDLLYQEQVPTNEDNGLFKISVGITENNLTPGNYSVRIYDDTTVCSQETEFEIYDINSVLKNINAYIKSKDSASLVTYINGKTDILGIEDWEIAEGVKVVDLTASVYGLLVNNDDNIADIKELQLEIQRAYVTDIINKLGDSEYGKAEDIIFNTYKDIFNIEQFSYYEQYKDLKEKNKEDAVLNAVTAKKGGFDSFGDILDTLSEQTLITAINNADFWNKVQETVSANSDYFTLKNIPTQVWKDICEYRPFDTLEAFEKRCNELKEKISKSTNTAGSGGGGGGGSGSSGMIVVGKPSVPTDEKTPGNFENTDSQNNTYTSFKDVPKSHWAYDYIEKLYQKQIVSGSGDDKFSPDAQLKREELIKMLVTVMGISPIEADESFTDVEADKWYAGYIAASKALGITKGKNDGSFGVGETLTREDAAVLCYRALNKETEQSYTETEFKDDALISDYAKGAVLGMVKSGIISGKDNGNFAPKEHCTRAEAAKILCGILDGISK